MKTRLKQPKRFFPSYILESGATPNELRPASGQGRRNRLPHLLKAQQLFWLKTIIPVAQAVSPATSSTNE
jgi:hypothetical protein